MESQKVHGITKLNCRRDDIAERIRQEQGVDEKCLSALGRAKQARGRTCSAVLTGPEEVRRSLDGYSEVAEGCRQWQGRSEGNWRLRMRDCRERSAKAWHSRWHSVGHEIFVY